MNLICSVCGSDAGDFPQWHNRDIGFGLCRKCADWLPTRGQHYNRDEFQRCYGIEGVHFQAQPIRIWDRVFTPVAVFFTAAEANAYMLEHDDTGLLHEHDDGRCYIARLADKGRLAVAGDPPRSDK